MVNSSYQLYHGLQQYVSSEKDGKATGWTAFFV
ncbi:hypothetical protein, partial [Candidatus Palibaumannia cicadellinicola]